MPLGLLGKKLVAVFTAITLVSTGIGFASVCSLDKAYAADIESNLQVGNITSPVLSITNMTQSYEIGQVSWELKRKGETYLPGNKDIANWAGHAVITFECTYNNLDSRHSVKTCTLQRSTNPTTGFSSVYSSNCGFDECEDKEAKVGETYYYRLSTDYNYYANDGTSYIINKLSNVVPTRTPPKKLSFTKATVKTPSGWKKQLKRTKKNKSLFKKSKSMRMKLSWKKRTDVDGYFVYKVTTKFSNISKAKSWQYPTNSTLIEDYWVEMTAKKWCKKVKTLKSSATSYICKIGNRKMIPYGSTVIYNGYYAIVPFIKQKGKTYLGECNKAFTLDYDYGGDRTPANVYPFNRRFDACFPFPLI